ncbi:DUF6807 family protein [Lignipirellula cremea]|uniref:Methane oxygenase PmoA n=1 Tax=Lignipirellula cremea TaxID=2528010 RepID=A0A518DLD7_9BACT|nr:DUF6807 family protein [Lignipirellula cremea]QDU92648.1 hypothetical protein Pla8534_03960 [Lignipirellula cremea]
MMRFVFSALLLSCTLATAAADESRAIVATRTDQGIRFAEQGGDGILFYQRVAKSQEGKFARANYLHPLYDLDGAVLTEDFPADHLHQRGVYWAWHQLRVNGKNAGDGWALKGLRWQVEEAQIEPDDGHSASLRLRVTWLSELLADKAGESLPVVEETTTIRVYRQENDARRIDFEIGLRALHPQVEIGGSEDPKGYSGFSVRARLPQEVQFVGVEGPVEPEKTALEAGPVIDLSARFDKATSGVAILQHPSLPKYPQTWILRRQKSMQNPVYPGRNAVVLPTDAPQVLRYRLVVHRGAGEPQLLRKWQADYAADQAVSP